YPNFMLPSWSVVLHLRSTLPQLSSLRISMYGSAKTVDDTSCRILAKLTSMFKDFGFYFRRRCNLSDDDDFLFVFDDYRKFIKQLCRCILFCCLLTNSLIIRMKRTVMDSQRGFD
ncbi:unnamed protein product, partial [Rotaria magnacalcarata]